MYGFICTEDIAYYTCCPFNGFMKETKSQLPPKHSLFHAPYTVFANCVFVCSVSDCKLILFQDLKNTIIIKMNVLMYKNTYFVSELHNQA